MSDELPNGWTVATLGQLTANPKLDIVSGPFGSNLKADEYVPNGVPIVRLQNVDRNRFLEKNMRFITAKKADELSAHSFKAGDIVISKLGDPVGKACIIPDSLPAGVVVADVVRVRPDEQRFSKQYAVRAINSPPVVSQINQEVKGSTRPRVNLNHLRDLQIPIAPLAEQWRIVAKLEEVLGKVDVSRARLAKIPALLKRFRQSVLAAACSGRLTTDWRDEHGMTLERDWRDAELRDICKTITDGDHLPPPKQQRGVPFLTIGNISSGHLDFSETRFVGEEYFRRIKDDRVPKLGDVLYTVVGATIGIPVLVNVNREFCFQRHIAILKPAKTTDSKFLWMLMGSPEVFHEAWERITGSAQPTLPLGNLRTIPVRVPPFDEQQEIVRRVEALFALAEKIETRFQQAQARVEQLTPALLAKAFRGELVPQDPADEPASVLLERIRQQGPAKITAYPEAQPRERRVAEPRAKARRR